MNEPDNLMTPPDPQLIRQRITITLDVIDEPGNDSIAVAALHTIVGQLEHDANFPSLIRLENPARTHQLNAPTGITTRHRR